MFACLQQWHVKNLNAYSTRKFLYLFPIINLNGRMTICLLWKGCKFVFRILILIIFVLFSIPFSVECDVYRWQRTIFRLTAEQNDFNIKTYWPVAVPMRREESSRWFYLWYLAYMLLMLWIQRCSMNNGCMGKMCEEEKSVCVCVCGME